MNIYVGNLSYETNESDLRKLFEQYGPVKSVTVIKDKATNRSRGFGFVEMENGEHGKAAIAALHEQPFMNRNLVVNEARPKAEGTGGGGGFRPRR